MLKLIVQFLAVLLLTSCSSGGDVKKFIEHVKDTPPGKIEPLPHLKEYTQISYNASKLREPFSASISNSPISMPSFKKEIVQQRRPDYERPREYLEGVPLDSLSMVGTIERRGIVWGLIVDRNGIIHRVKPGNYLGQNSGKITDITENKIFLEETIPDGNGGWVGRKADMSLTK